jgi:twitching motility protein PilT
MASLDTYLKQMLENDGSDLHLSVGSVPKIRASGRISALSDEIITADKMSKLLQSVTPPGRWEDYLLNHDLDLAYEISGLARFRGSFFYNHWGQAAVFRQIPAEILSFDTLKLPEVLKDVCQYKEGLVLVTGPTGSGKSTTLAAMMDYINENFQKHIITVEDPIEFVHLKKKSVIVHREVGEHSHSFANALRGAMRADPDIVLVGEMRELETIKLALSCASMGMLVFGTLHTNNAPKTIDRIIDAFPADEQAQIRVLLAGCLTCIVSQLLCKKIPSGRVAVHEILLQHDALPNTIRIGKTSEVRGIIESSRAQGMLLMDSSIAIQLEAGNISPEEAYMKAANKDAFKKFLPTLEALSEESEADAKGSSK